MLGLYQGSLPEETIPATVDKDQSKWALYRQNSGLFHGPPRGSLTLITLRDALICRNQEKARGEKDKNPKTLAAQILPQPSLAAGLWCPCEGAVGFAGRQNT